jgi:lipopolysaccharide biosynthesis glycosyltransferase
MSTCVENEEKLTHGINMELTNQNRKLERLIFASSMLPDKASERKFLLLVESIRDFAGSLSQAPIWCFTLDNERDLSKTAKDRLSTLNTTFINFKTETEIPRFPFMRKVFLSAQAESIAQGKTDLIVWLDSDTIVLQEPKGFLLQDDKSLGCRPVHHTIIGSRYGEPLDLFWMQIYRHCRVPEDRVFPMMTHMDGTRIRPYFNAGLLVVRPEKRLLQIWRDNFLEIYKATEFQELYEEDERYAVFMHQAVLTGTVLSTLQTDEIQELPPTYNYPLHLYWEDVTGNRPSSLEELITFRYEDFFESLEWRKRIPAKEKLKQWIGERLLR